MIKKLTAPSAFWPLLFAFAFIAAIEYLLGWRNIWAAWRHVPTALAILTVFLLVLSYGCRAARLQWYFKKIMTGRFFDALRLTLIHNFLNHLVPLRGGEASFPYLLKRDFGIPVVTAIATLLWFRLLDLLVILAIGGALLGGANFPGARWSGLLVLLLPIPWGLFFARGWGERWLQSHLQFRVARLILRLLEGLPNNLHTLTSDFIWTVMNWLLKLAALASLLAGLAEVSSGAAALAAIAGELTGVLPIHAPAGLGTYEAGIVAGLRFFGVSPAEALAPAVNLHLVLLATACISGIAALLMRRADGTFSSDVSGETK